MKKIALLVALVLSFQAIAWAWSEDKPKPSAGAKRAKPKAISQPAAKPVPGEGVPSEKETREAEFAESMSNASLVGFFTTAGKEKEQGLTAETYKLGKVVKLPEEDNWKFEYRYGDSGIVIPLPTLQVKWAGDTPVITVTDMSIPGLGTFTARVVVYRGEYAGTWSAGDHGGHLFGKIVKEEKAPAGDDAKPKDEAPVEKPDSPK